MCLADLAGGQVKRDSEFRWSSKRISRVTTATQIAPASAIHFEFTAVEFVTSIIMTNPLCNETAPSIDWRVTNPFFLRFRVSRSYKKWLWLLVARFIFLLIRQSRHEYLICTEEGAEDHRDGVMWCNMQNKKQQHQQKYQTVAGNKKGERKVRILFYPFSVADSPNWDERMGKNMEEVLPVDFFYLCLVEKP